MVKRHCLLDLEIEVLLDNISELDDLSGNIGNFSENEDDSHELETCAADRNDSNEYEEANAQVSIRLVNTQCWPHKLNLVGNVWAVELCDLNHCVLQEKHIFLNTRKRKHAYIQFLAQKYGGVPTEAKLFPIPVITRWNSWFESVEYLGEYLCDIVEFVETVEEYGLFVEAAVKTLWSPASNVDSEGSFSRYCNVMSDRRTALTSSNMEVMVSLSFSG
ncbi:uncharacterized protein LOC126484761 [Schistocerca serialis cubense]|uniref:uncharacterized protein LOC126484761 n=1 Tax=Schistocerca serialis cubense TaxID=2023355 RepID=UPI00214E308B|nr:uncharacterized protein LOC126484761 [Schistocerca serialis cubense]